MRLKAEIKYTNTDKAADTIVQKCRAIVKKHAETVMKRYIVNRKKHYELAKIIREDIIDEYVNALTKYDYSGAEKREHITELIMRARGREPSESGSYKEVDAEKWADESTETFVIMDKLGKKQKAATVERYRLKKVYVNSLVFHTLSIVRNEVLVDLEKGTVSWATKNVRNVAKMLRAVANEGLTTGRISPEEWEEIYVYASSPELFRLKADERQYFKTAVEKADEKNKEKWINIVKKHLMKGMSSINLPKAVFKIPAKNVKVSVIGTEDIRVLGEMLRKPKSKGGLL